MPLGPTRSRSRTTRAIPLALAVIFIAPAGCSDEAPASGAAAPRAEPAGLSVSLAPVLIQPAERSIEVTGALFGEEEATISSKLKGRVVAIARDVGDAVEAGGPLAQIERLDYELELAEREAAVQSSLARLGLDRKPEGDFDASAVPTVRRARAEASNAEARLARARQLFEQKPPLISEQDFADIETSWEVARENAEVELLTARSVLAEARTQLTAADAARQRLVDTAVLAPRPDGRADIRYQVAQRLVSLGEYVSEGRPVFRLVAADVVKLRADAPERFAGQILPGQPALVRVESSPEPARGVVSRVSPSIDPSTRTFKVEAVIQNPTGALRPGAFARATIPVRTDQGVTFVPASAVVTFAGVQRVYSVKDGKAVEHRVHLGRRQGDHVEIVGGLPVTEVVSRGAQSLSPGAPVTVRATAP